MRKFSKRKKKPKNLKSLLSRAMRVSHRKIHVGDRYLTPASKKDMNAFIAADKTDQTKYVTGVLECNTFALYFHAAAKKWFFASTNKNIAVGTVWTAKTWLKESHAFNFYLGSDTKVHFIEPQTDKEVFLQNYGKVVFVYI